MDLPDFLGIGALKAGTSYLDAMLRDHPQTWLPPRLKEVEFFNRHYERGPEWYEQQFRGSQGRVRGEVSPQYLFDGRVAGRIHALIPEARLIVSVRDPVQRAYSQYKHWVQETGYRRSFDDFLAEHPGAVDRGRYLALLDPYLQLFAREQILVIVFEELVDQPQATMEQVYRFVGVDAAHVPGPSDEAVNASGSPRFHGSYVAVKRVTRWLQDRGATSVIAAAKRTGLGRVFRPSDDPPDFAPLPPATARSLAETYADDVAALSAFLGRDLGLLWSTT